MDSNSSENSKVSVASTESKVARDVQLILLSLVLAAILIGFKHLWGTNFASYFQPLVGFILALIIAVSAHPRISKRALEFLDSFSISDRETAMRGATFFIPFSLLMLTLFLFFPSVTTFLGDGNLRINQITDGKAFLPTELLDFFLHSQIYSLFFEPYDYSAHQSYYFSAAICGVIFVITSFRLAAYLNSAQPITTFFLMFSSGMTVLFFGYIESYALIAALMPLLLMKALKVADGRLPLSNFILWYLIAGAIHSVAIILLGGAMLALLSSAQTAESADRYRKPMIALALATLAGLLGLYICRFAGWAVAETYLMPLLASTDFRQGIFTANHFVNLLNWLMLAGLPAILLASISFRTRNLSRALSDRSIFLAAWLIIPCALFLFFFIPALGGPRDWDLFSLAPFIMIPATLIIYLRTVSPVLPAAVVPIVVAGLVTVGSFAAVNNSMPHSADHFSDIIEVSAFKNMFKEYGTLSSHAETYPELADRRLEFTLKAWEEQPYTKKDSVFILQQLGSIYTALKDEENAWRYLMMAYQADTLNFYSHLMMVNYVNQFASAEELKQLAATIEQRFPDHAGAMMLTGKMYLQAADTAHGEVNMEKAFQLDARDYNVLFNYGLHMLKKKNTDKAIELLKMAQQMKKSNFLPNYYLSGVFIERSDPEQALRYMTNAARTMSSSDERAKYQALEQALRDKRDARNLDR